VQDEPPPEKSRIVWARGNTFSLKCPKSIISQGSLYYLEQFVLWKESGMGSLLSFEAKTADAILMLEKVWQSENQSGEIEK
jgi:hypothetical protein